MITISQRHGQGDGQTTCHSTRHILVCGWWIVQLWHENVLL